MRPPRRGSEEYFSRNYFSKDSVVNCIFLSFGLLNALKYSKRFNLREFITVTQNYINRYVKGIILYPF